MRQAVPASERNAPPVVLEALGRAVPGDPIPQRDVRAKAEEILGAVAPDLLDKMQVFETVGIDTRHFANDLDWYIEPHGWRDRGASFERVGTQLLQEAAEDCLQRADVDWTGVDGIVFVNTTGISAPSLDARLLDRLPFRRDVRRAPVWGLGCAGGVAGLDLAADLARARPGSRQLLLCLELCSLSFNLSELDTASFVASTLFADGCAAALVRAAPPRSRWPVVGAGRMHQWPDSSDVMGWDVRDDSLGVVFSRRIPDIVRADLAGLVGAYEKESGLAPTRYAFHPGGAKVLTAYEAALGMPPERLGSAREVLRRYGNMSSPTALFVLEEELRRPLPEGETMLLAAFGPGFSAALGHLQGGAA